MLGLAAGDTAGGAWELGYSAYAEQATVVAYHLIEYGRLHTAQLIDAIREMDGSQVEEPVYRAESPTFRGWLDRAAAGMPVADEESSIDPVPRSVPLGVVNRREPEKLRDEVIELGLIFHRDAVTLLGGGVAAAAVAASCFGQSGRDLIEGVRESAESIAAAIAGVKGIVRPEAMSVALEDLAHISGLVGITDGEAALAAVGGDQRRAPWDLIKAGLLISAPIAERDHLPVEQAARSGGSGLGAMVGGIVGARVGIRAWPWAFANDTWFAEIGRRLVRGPAEIRDLPIPYAVEQHLMSGESPGFH
jgi:hypothetical protein